MNKHSGETRLRRWWRQAICAWRHGGRHPLDCNYSRKCDGNHVCTACGWTGQ